MTTKSAAAVAAATETMAVEEVEGEGGCAAICSPES